MQFTKMHGLGNDFVVVVPAQVNNYDWPDLARRTCDRHVGIGADGLILVLPSRDADFRMRMFNPDGSEAEMCGNGIRCFGKFVWDSGFWESPVLTVDTLAGLQRLRLNVQDRQVVSVRVDMGQPVVDAADSRLDLAVTGADLSLTLVSLGNPHAVAFSDQPINTYSLLGIGPQVEHNPAFPNRTNFEIVNVLSQSEIRVRVWERGAGLTLACGTGACAATVAARVRGLTGPAVTVHLPGGDLLVEWQGPGHPVVMTGPAVTVFKGDWLL
jgi:diaminopimelate epimerase